MAPGGTVVEIDGRRLTVGNLTKVIYPATGTTKGEVINYYADIAPVLLPHLAGRPVTRKRWPDGVLAHSFFRKDLEVSAPKWVPRWPIPHHERTVTYPTADSAAVLAWFGQLAALELHVPQWLLSEDGYPGNPNRVVFDLDPGPGVGLAECAEVARAVKDHLDAADLWSVPVTSGSKGIHLYAPVDGTRTSAEVSVWAHAIARAVQSRLPTLALSQMKRALRDGKVFIDWSQNNGNKTTISPYSLRGREHPTVAAPRTWAELADPDLRHLEFGEVLKRVAERGDLLHRLLPASGVTGSPPDDSLAPYRAKRDRHRTPEPVPAAGDPTPASTGDTFVIQEHHARALHWDFRLEHDGVLASWALPKGLPLDPSHNRLAVQTEDHPLDYGSFEGMIPHGEYGGGEVTIWDSGTYSCEKWRKDEIIFSLNSERSAGRYALIQTQGRQWLLHKMKSQQPHQISSISAAAATSEAPSAAAPNPTGATQPPTSKPTTGAPAIAVEELSPMLATPGVPGDVADAASWAYEIKWDGVRALARVRHGRVSLFSRNDNDITKTYPELAELASLLGGHEAVLDGEIVACRESGTPSFSLLQQRMKLSGAAEISRVAQQVPVRFLAFDVLMLNGISLLGKRYTDRRRLLDATGIAGEFCAIPEVLPGSVAAALDETRRRGLEGVLAKRRDSIYRPGKRSRDWVKLKHFQDQEVIIGGWRPGNGKRAGTIGSLLIGVPADGGLRYGGRVGTGFDDAMLDQLATLLAPLRRTASPFADVVPSLESKDAIWVDPVLVGEVVFAEWSDNGRLRQASWRGLRPDKEPGEVRLAPAGLPGDEV